MLMTSKAKDKQCAEMFGDNKKMILHVRKEVYWEAILTQGEAIVYDLQIQGEELPDDFGKFVKEQRSLHIGYAFHEIWNDLNATKDGDKQSCIEQSSRRVVYR